MSRGTNGLEAMNADEAVRLTQKLISIPSPLWQESEIARWIGVWMSERDFEVELQAVPLRDGRVTHQTIGTLKGDGTGPNLMLCGHTDTSDWNGRPYREEEWRHDPWSGEISNGRVYGLGAINMKAGLAAIMVAADWVRRSGRSLKGDLIVAAVAAETGGGVGAIHLCGTGLRPDYCIVTEAGNLDVGVISTGYVQGKILVKGEFKARVPYVNPIEKAALLIDRVGQSYAPLRSRKDGGWITFDPHPLIPGYPRMSFRGISHFQDVTELEFDLRIVPGMTEETVVSDLLGLLSGIAAEDPGFSAELVVPLSKGQPNMPARAATDADLPLVVELVKAHRHVSGSEPVIGAGHRIGATSDACHFKGVGIQCVEYGPGFIPTWPMVDECIEIAQVETATRVLAEAALRLVAADGYATQGGTS